MSLAYRPRDPGFEAPSLSSDRGTLSFVSTLVVCGVSLRPFTANRASTVRVLVSVSGPTGSPGRAADVMYAPRDDRSPRRRTCESRKQEVLTAVRRYRSQLISVERRERASE